MCAEEYTSHENGKGRTRTVSSPEYAKASKHVLLAFLFEQNFLRPGGDRNILGRKWHFVSTHRSHLHQHVCSQAPNRLCGADPGSPVTLAPLVVTWLRRSIRTAVVRRHHCSESTKRFAYFVLSVGIEPTLPAPQASVLSIERRERSCCLRVAIYTQNPRKSIRRSVNVSSCSPSVTPCATRKSYIATMFTL